MDVKVWGCTVLYCTFECYERGGRHLGDRVSERTGDFVYTLMHAVISASCAIRLLPITCNIEIIANNK